MRITLLIIALPGAALSFTTQIPPDSLVQPVQNETILKSKVKYSARDSMRFDIANQKMYLFGEAEVNYEDLSMKAGYIELDMKTNLVYATGIDSGGKTIEKPVFSQGTENFKANKMTYNFETKKGKITDVMTQEADGYIHGETVKKDSNNTFFIKNGKYTTCDLEHPHFYIGASRLKVIQNDKIVTGPAYLVIGDVPTPLAVPFGFFPNKRGRKNGVIIPTYGESRELGFFLRDGGVYFGLNDYMDVALKGDIYSKGSWGVKLISNYKKMYKHSGYFDIRYSNIRFGEKELPTSALQKDVIIRWTHNQDGKAKPGESFSANVEAGSSQYNRFNSYNPNAYLKNTMQSGITYSKSFLGTPFFLSLAGRHNQNLQTKQISVSLPLLNLNMNRIYPFRNTSRPGTHWYDKIGVSYSAITENKIDTYDSLLLKPAALKQLKNGMQHSIPISTSLNVLKYFTFTPSFNFTSRWYLQTYAENYDAALKKAVADTVKGFRTANDFSFSANMNTKIYGDYIFTKGNLKQIRHLIIPNFSYSYRPDFSKSNWGYYKTVQSDSLGNTKQYSIFQNTLYGSPSGGESSLLNWSLSNTLEMKVRSKKDTVGHEKKLSLIDMFFITGSYNMAAKSFKWSNINMNARTRLFKLFDINFNASVDPYQLDSIGRRIDKLQWDKNKNIGRLTFYNLAFNASFRKDMFTKNTATGSRAATPIQADFNFLYMNPNYYVDFNIPWTLNIAYSFNHTKPGIASATETQTLGFSGDLSLTPKWKIGFNSGYDFIAKAMSYTQLSIYRDLHCWEMAISWVPFGPRQFYSVDIKVKSAVLQDLKISRRRDWYDNQ